MGHQAAVQSITLVPGRHQVAASLDAYGTVHLWSTASGQLLSTFGPVYGQELTNTSIMGGDGDLGRGPGAGAEDGPPMGIITADRGRGWQALGGLPTGKSGGGGGES
jgi:hypothetical protein